MANWFVDTNGISSNSGDIRHPLDIGTAIGASSPAAAGDTIYLRSGTYTPLVDGETSLAYIDGVNGVAGKGVYTFKINGAAGNVITIRNYPGERVKINGAFHMVNGQASHLRLQGIECAITPTTRLVANDVNITHPPIYVTGAGCQFVNCYFHEYYIGSFYPAVAGGTNIIHGCIMGNVGYYRSVPATKIAGYCIYTHNAGGSDFLIQKNAFFGSVHQYNINPHTTSANITAYQIDDNLLFGGGIAMGSNSALNRDNYIRRNYVYNPDGTPATALVPIGLRVSSYDNTADPLGEEIDLEYNYVVSGGPTNTQVPVILQARNLRSRYNTIIDRTAATIFGVIQHFNPTGAITEFVNDFNTYYTDYANPFYSNASGSFVRYTLADWRTATGYDTNSTIAGVLPTTNVTKVTANDYETGRGQIAIYNWEGLSEVSVDISSLGLTTGAKFRLNNILNYRNEYRDYTYTSGTLKVPMTGWTQGKPLGYDVPLTWHTSPGTAFWMFEIEPLDFTDPTYGQTTDNLSDSVIPVYVPYYQG